MDPVLFISLLIIILSLIALSWFAGTDAPYVPTTTNLDDVLKIAGVGKGKTFFELGSGDGRVVLEAAKKGSNAIGIEQSLIRVLYSRYKTSKFEISNATFIHGNIFNQNYHSADIVYIYLLQKGVDRLENKLKKELKKNSIIVTQKYHFKHLKPYRELDNFHFYQT